MIRNATSGWLEGRADTAVLSTLSGGARRLARLPARQTIVNNTRRDPSKPRWARTSGAEACPFCLMLVSRGAVYSKNTAHFEAHDHCRCDAIPVFNDSQIPEESQRLADEWAKVTQGAGNNAEAQAMWADHIKTKTAGTAGGGGKTPKAALASGSPDPKKIARDLLVKARGAEPPITADIEAAIGAGGATRARADTVLKGEDSLVRKVADQFARRRSPSKINDVIRYTAVIEDRDYWDGGDALLTRIAALGYQREGEFNGWNRSGYKGRNVTMRSPGGQLFEIQLHTAASLDAAEATHAIWEIVRLRDTPNSLRKRLTEQANKVFARVPIPPARP